MADEVKIVYLCARCSKKFDREHDQQRVCSACSRVGRIDVITSEMLSTGEFCRSRHRFIDEIISKRKDKKWGV